jgi:hypothetical protein
MTAKGAPAARSWTATICAAPLNMIIDIASAAIGEAPAAIAPMPQTMPNGIMPSSIGEMSRAPSRNAGREKCVRMDGKTKGLRRGRRRPASGSAKYNAVRAAGGYRLFHVARVPMPDQTTVVRQDRPTVHRQRAIRIRLGGEANHGQAVVSRLRTGFDGAIAFV